MKMPLAVALVFVASICSCGKNQLFGPTAYEIEYRVTGTASRVDVTYTNRDGGTSQESSRTVPWSHEFECGHDNFLYISAQNNGSSGSVTVTIYKNGTAIKTSTSSGAYVIATASATS
jgi:hypothetical protein